MNACIYSAPIVLSAYLIYCTYDQQQGSNENVDPDLSNVLLNPIRRVWTRPVSEREQ